MGAAAGYLSLWTVFWAYKLATGKDGMGYGDFKMNAAVGAFVGWKLLPLVILLSLLVTYSVVFAAGFSGEAKRHATPGLLQSPFGETLTAYVAALVVSLTVLWVFGRVDGGAEPFEIYAKTVLLAFPASVAAAAGRLAV